jgi:hypothetical protein
VKASHSAGISSTYDPSMDLVLAATRVICYIGGAAIPGGPYRHLLRTTGGRGPVVAPHPPTEIAPDVRLDPSLDMPAQGVLLCTHVCGPRPSPSPLILWSEPAARWSGPSAWLSCRAACRPSRSPRRGRCWPPWLRAGSRRSNPAHSCKPPSSIPSECTSGTPPTRLHCDTAPAARAVVIRIRPKGMLKRLPVRMLSDEAV